MTTKIKEEIQLPEEQLDDIQQAMKTLSQAMKADESYVLAWYANLKMAAFDYGLDLKTSGEMSSAFLNRIFDLNIRPEDFDK